jgi:hypothetical protein
MVLLASSWLGMRAMGLPGLGMAFLATGAFACLLSWAILRRSIGLHWTRENLITFLALASGMAALRVATGLGGPGIGLGTAAVLTALFGAYSLRIFWQELGGGQALRARFKLG